LQKGLRSLEVGISGLEDLNFEIPDEKLAENLRTPNAERIFYIKHALKKKINIDKIFELTGIDRWFLHNIKEIVELEEKIKNKKSSAINPQLSTDLLRKAKEYGFSDRQLSRLLKTDESLIHKLRAAKGILPTFKLVDTCGAEFEAFTPYYYSTYEK
jgi:carbamoyl-phosphate synthase large subunit